MVSEMIVGAMLGIQLLSHATSAEGPERDLVARTGQVWELVLAGIVTEASFEYFRQFLAREALRHAQLAASSDDTVRVGEVE